MNHGKGKGTKVEGDRQIMHIYYRYPDIGADIIKIIAIKLCIQKKVAF